MDCTVLVLVSFGQVQTACVRHGLRGSRLEAELEDNSSQHSFLHLSSISTHAEQHRFLLIIRSNLQTRRIVEIDRVCDESRYDRR